MGEAGCLSLSHQYADLLCRVVGYDDAFGVQVDSEGKTYYIYNHFYSFVFVAP